MLRLPWTTSTAPNVALNITQECNIACRGCYNKNNGRGHKPVEAVFQDLDVALSRCPVHTISLMGGEPTLHPQLPEIIRGVRKKGLKVAVLTNGVALDRPMAARLGAAGLDQALLHIDEGQPRPDMPPNPSFETISDLRAELAARLAAEGIDAGLSITIYPEYVDRMPRLFDFILHSPHINLLLCLVHVDFPALMRGARRLRQHAAPDALAVIDGESPDYVAPWAKGRVSTRDMQETVRKELGLEPAVYLPSRLGRDGDMDFPSWLFYYAAVVKGAGPLRVFNGQGSWLERLLLPLGRWLTGRYYFYQAPSRGRTIVEVLLNAFARARFWQGLAFAAAALRPGNRVLTKRFVLDNSPMLTPEGQITCAEPCAHRAVRNGQLVPVCMAGYSVEELKTVCGVTDT